MYLFTDDGVVYQPKAALDAPRRQEILAKNRAQHQPHSDPESSADVKTPLFLCHNCYRQVEQGVLYCAVCDGEQVSKKTYKEVEVDDMTAGDWLILGAFISFGIAAIVIIRWAFQNGWIS